MGGQNSRFIYIIGPDSTLHLVQLTYNVVSLINMASLDSIFKRDQRDKLTAVIKTACGKLICYTGLSDNERKFKIGASDGTEVWKTEFTEDEIDNYRTIAEVSSKDAYLAKIRSSFESSDLQASQVPAKLLLTFGSGSRAFTLDLYETTANEKRQELQELLFKQQEKISVLEKGIKDAQEKVDSLQKATAQSDTCLLSPVQEPDTKKSKITRQRQKKGESVINPGSRRLKAAVGVEFE